MTFISVVNYRLQHIILVYIYS